MTTPGQQLTPGDENTPPVFGIPDGAYVGDAGLSNSITDLNGLTEAEAKKRMQAPMAGSFNAQRNGFWGALNGLLGLVQGGIDLVVGVVDAVVGGLTAIINSIGSLFGASRRDAAAIDDARVAGENAIVANMSASLEYLDEIQRVGGAFMDYPSWMATRGGYNPHPLPLGGADPNRLYGAFPLQQGTYWHPPTVPLTHATDDLYGNDDAARGVLAQGSGTLELLEPGLWMIYFQAALRQAGDYSTLPVDVWCYVSSNSLAIPVGAPPASGNMDVYLRSNGFKSIYGNPGQIHTFGRAGQYLGSRDSDQGGGNTVSGYMMCYLDSPGWFIHMSCTGYHHFGGPASTFMFAQKVNSSTLRGDIAQAQADIAASLPGQPVPKELDETTIAAMVAQAADLEATPVVVPPLEQEEP